MNLFLPAVRRLWPIAIAPMFAVWAVLLRPPYLVGSALLSRSCMGCAAVALLAVAFHPSQMVRGVAAVTSGFALLSRAMALVALPGPLVWQTRVSGSLTWAALAVTLTLLLQDRR